MPVERDRILKDNLILCEGKDALNFLICMLESEESKALSPCFATDIQVFDFGGNNDLATYIENLQKMDDYSRVKTILVIRDAENDAQKASKEIITALCKNGFLTPEKPYCWSATEPAVGWLLFPACGKKLENGTLEDLCLSIIKDDNWENIATEIDGFLGSVKQKCNKQLPREFKNKLHTYFSATNEYVSLKIGEAARAGAFDWGSGKLELLRSFILQKLGDNSNSVY